MSDTVTAEPPCDTPPTPRDQITREERQRAQKKRVNYALAGVLMGQGLTIQEVLPRVGAKNVESLRRGLYRKGITDRVIKGVPDTVTRRLPPSQAVTLRVVEAARDVLREKMKAEISANVDALAATPRKRGIGHIMDRAATLEPLARTAKIVCGWGDNDSQSLVQVDAVSEARETLEAEIVPDAPQITDAQESKSSACGESAPTNTGKSDTPAQ